LASNDDLYTDTTGDLNGTATDTLEPTAGEDETRQPTHAKTGRNLRKPVLVGVAALVVALVAGGGIVAAAHKTVSVTSTDRSRRWAPSPVRWRALSTPPA